MMFSDSYQTNKCVNIAFRVFKSTIKTNVTGEHRHTQKQQKPLNRSVIVCRMKGNGCGQRSLELGEVMRCEADSCAQRRGAQSVWPPGILHSPSLIATPKKLTTLNSPHILDFPLFLPLLLSDQIPRGKQSRNFFSEGIV